MSDTLSILYNSVNNTSITMYTCITINNFKVVLINILVHL